VSNNNERTKDGEDAFVSDTDELVDEWQRELRRCFDAVRRVTGAVAFIDGAAQRATDARETVDACLSLEAE